jgi:hypothetical protein
MTVYTIATCMGCQRTWALDYQPDICSCDDTADTTFEEIEADDYRQALDIAEGTA